MCIFNIYCCTWDSKNVSQKFKRQFRIFLQSESIINQKAHLFLSSTTLFNPATKDHSPLDQLRIKWIELVQMGKFVHKIFNSTSINLFTLEPSTQNKDVIFKDFDEKHSIFLSNSNNEEEIKG